MKQSRVSGLSISLSLLIVALISQPAVADSWQDKVHPSLLQARSPSIEFIVVLEDQADLRAASRAQGKQARGRFVFEALRQTADRTQPALIELLEAERASYRSLWIVNMIWVRGNAELLETLATRAEVRRLDPNPQISMSRHLGDIRPAAGASVRAVEWNVQQINADQVWALGYYGAGVVVGGADTGYAWTHPAIMEHYRGTAAFATHHNYSWHDAIHSGGGVCGADSPVPCDDFGLGHGTHTMGTMVGDDGGGNQIGISPESKWIGCRNMDQGIGTPITYAECFQWFVAPTDLDDLNPRPALAPHVISNSWVCPPDEGCSPDTLQAVVENTRAAGIVVVTAAGNDGAAGCSTIEFPPAIYDSAITVGATNQADEIQIFSSLGPVLADGSNRIKPDVSAPGLNVRSALVGGDYGPGSGTSMATPHVTGVVALLLSARPDLIGDVATVEQIIKGSAFPRTSSQACGGYSGDEIPNPIYGWGRVDALEALLGDVDADGADNLTDCLPAGAEVWAAPEPVADLRLDQDGSRTSLSWTPPAGPGGTQVVYDLLRGTVASDFSGATCVLSNAAESVVEDSEPAASIFYYLVRVKNVCGENLGTSSDDVPRATDSCL